jgi:ABC-type metal ion transport system substrate-binding protein
METPNMTRITTLSLLTATALLSSMAVASAAAVTVKVAGRSPAEIRSEVIAAANKVCSAAIRADVFSDYDSQDECVTATVDATMKQVAARDLGYQVASSDAAPAR